VNSPRWVAAFFVAHLTLLQVASPSANDPKRAAGGPLITLHAPHPEQLEVALDEVELDWSGDPGAKGRTAASYAVPIPGSRVVEREAARAAVAVSGAASLADVLMISTALKAADPGAEVHLSLYGPGLPRNKASRRLLTREVGLLVLLGEDPQGVLGGLPLGPIRAVPGVPGGYVVEAADPIAALDLADALRQRPGVRSAYPLLKRLYFPR
jgi:hypothetical protein